MCRPSSTYYTKDQTMQLFGRHQCTELLPCKGKRVVIALANKIDFDIDLIEIEKSSQKATYGGMLYKVTQSSKEGRKIDAALPF